MNAHSLICLNELNGRVAARQEVERKLYVLQIGRRRFLICTKSRQIISLQAVDYKVNMQYLHLMQPIISKCEFNWFCNFSSALCDQSFSWQGSLMDADGTAVMGTWRWTISKFALGQGPSLAVSYLNSYLRGYFWVSYTLLILCINYATHKLLTCRRSSAKCDQLIKITVTSSHGPLRN